MENSETKPKKMNTKSTQKPKLSFWEIWNMSFGFLGIQFGFALQNANVSRIFETLGADVSNIPILWIAAPVTGLIVQPIVGHLSDQTWTRLGRRRPYFLGGAILASLALIIMPNSPTLWVAAGMLWIMDACINISMEPFRAFVGDMLPADQHTKGFAMQTFFIGVGSVVASALPYILANWVGVSNVAPPGEIPASVAWSFYLGATAFIGAVLWTVFRSKEYPPEQFKKYADQHARDVSREAATKNVTKEGKSQKFSIGTVLSLVGLGLAWLVRSGGYAKELYIFGFGLLVFGLVMVTAGFFQKAGKHDHGLVTVVSDFLNMPKTMAQLAVVQFFSWFALFALWIYTTAAVTGHIYGTHDTSSLLYNKGANWVGICFAIYNGFSAVVALALPYFGRILSRKLVHAIALAVGGISLASIYYISDPTMLILPMLGIGLAWAGVLTMPYAILSDALPLKKMGVYMGIFNFFIVIPQIVAAGVLGFVVGEFFNDAAIYALVIGGISFLIAAFAMLFVTDTQQ